ncbi:MAG TPA: glycoside hydrolase family 52 protein [Tepidisphaeraceae bacterium]|nr:glycoside hydrolase family 52 protein [Tepidisphaeraceae bacterium]
MSISNGAHLALHRSIDFNAQHSPAGAFMSFTCGHFGSGGGIGLQMGKPAGQNLYIGVKMGNRKAKAPVRCLPFFQGSLPATSAAASFQVDQASSTSSKSLECYSADEIQRHFHWATDAWTTPDFTFSIYSPFAPIPEPRAEAEAVRASLRASLLPAVVATLKVDNRNGKQTKTAVFAIDFVEPGARLLAGETDTHGRKKLGFAWRREMGVAGSIEGEEHDADDFFAIQRWSVAEGLADINPIHALGTCGGLAMEVPAGEVRTMVLAIGSFLDGVVTTGLEGRYYYTRLYSGLDDVLGAALQRSSDLRARAARLDAKLLASGLTDDQQFLIAHGTHSYYGNTQLLDVGGEPFWIVSEGEYCMMNTLDLSVDHAFWELKQNPWVVANVLTNFVRRYSYQDQLRSRGGQTLPGGVSFCHDMGINNHFSPPGHSSYELPHLTGCFSYMTQEQLCNWVLTAACYVARTADTGWLMSHAHLFDACAESMRARANPRTGLMIHDSARCAGGQEITTYDSLDESLGQSRANTYLGVKCWATWVALEMTALLRKSAGDLSASSEENLADELEIYLAACATDGTIPAVMEKDNPGYHSRILPVVEGLIYPAYWLSCLTAWPAGAPSAAACESPLRTRMQGPFIDVLARHMTTLLTDPRRLNLFDDGGLKLSSTSNNSWMSKIALVQHVARHVLHLDESDPRLAQIFRDADRAHVRWQIEGSSFWACSDQFVSGVAKGSRYYPRIITAALWMEERPGVETTIAAPQATTVATDLPGAIK